MLQTKIYIASTQPLLDNIEMLRRIYELAPAERKAKANAFVFLQDKALSLGAWAILQFALTCENIDNAILATMPNGKPYLANKELYFSLSHANKKVMCAIATANIGCDLELITNDNNLEAIAKLTFTAEELNIFYEAKDRISIFFQLWTKKESYFKLGQINAPVYFRLYNIQDGYQYACACLNNNFPLNMMEVNLCQIFH